MSNSSEIPNLEYNAKRYQVYRTLKKYLKEHPDDQRAKDQVVMILSLPNIERGGPFGNSNLLDWGAIHSEEIRSATKKRTAGQASQDGEEQ